MEQTRYTARLLTARINGVTSMYSKHLAMLCAAIFAVGLLVPVNASAAVNRIGVGDFWEYGGTLAAGEFGARGNITLKMTVAEKLKEDIGGSPTGILRLNLSGKGDVQVQNVSGFNVSAKLTVRGNLDRLESNFSEVALSVILDVEIPETLGGTSFTVPATVGAGTGFAPPLDDYIGDNHLAVGTRVVSDAHVAGGTWFSILFRNQSMNISQSEHLEMEITRENVSITVPAGTFDCWEVKVSSTVNSSANASVGYFYYSEKVGNYVQMRNASASLGFAFGSLNLTGFSYKKSNAFSFTSPTGLVIIGVIVAAIVVVAVLAVLDRARKRRNSEQTTYQNTRSPPPGEMPPPIPPPPSGQ